MTSQIQDFLTDDSPFLYAESRWFSRKDLSDLAHSRLAVGDIESGSIKYCSVKPLLEYITEFLACTIIGASFMPVISKAGNRVAKCIENLEASSKEMVFGSDEMSPSLILSSGGTISGGKAICLGQKGLVCQAVSFAKLSGSVVDTFYCSVAPKDYMAGIFNNLLVPLVSGSRVVWVNMANPTDDDVAALDLFGNHINRVVATPFLIEHTIALGVFGSQKVEFISTGAPGNNHLIDIVGEKNWSLAQAFGVTELGGSFSYSPSVERNKWSNQGQLIPEIQCRTVSGTDRLEFKSPLSALAVVNVDGEVQKIRNKWFDTGDLGSIKGGRLSVIGRESEVLDRDGFLVAIPYVESIAREMEGVIDAVCTLQVDRKPEKIILHAVIDKQYDEPSKFVASLFRFLKDSLDSWEIPDEIILVDSLPRAHSGKPLRAKLGNRNGSENG